MSRDMHDLGSDGAQGGNNAMLFDEMCASRFGLHLAGKELESVRLRAWYNSCS